MAFDLLAAVRKGVVLGDGAMGTQIHEAGFQDLLCTEELNVSHPEVIRDIHRRYIEAGSRLILTNTFGCSGYKLRRAGLASEKMEELIRSGCRLAREAAGDRVCVVADIGSTGEVVEPYGEIPVKDLEQDFAAQARIVAGQDVDAIILETMSDLNEMEIALRAVKGETDVPVIASMTFSASGKTSFGQSVEHSARRLKEFGADFLGANCSVSIEFYPAIVKTLAEVSGLPVMAQPNAGAPEATPEGVHYRETPDKMADGLAALLEAGAVIVGGCCGTTPETIRLFREKLESLGRLYTD